MKTTMKPLTLVLFLTAVGCAQNYPLGPESQPQPNVPQGTVTRGLKLEPGKYYPGVPHNYSLYVPAQYIRCRRAAI
jgi:hypothetical protein